MDYQHMEFREAIASIAYAFEQAASSSSSSSRDAKSGRARSTFQWGGSIFALFLLILNQIGRSSRTQSHLLVLFLFTSFPEVLFKILRGQFGCWIAFLATAANLFFPQYIPVSRFLLFVITPNWIAHGLRESMVGGVFCVIICFLLVMAEVRGIGGFANCSCNFHCFAYGICIAFLLFFTILYLCLGAW